MSYTADQQRAFEILEIVPGATMEQIQQRYRDLVQVWHPDRFNTARLKTLAERKLIEINAAYDSLRADIGTSAPDPEGPAQEDLFAKKATESPRSLTSGPRLAIAGVLLTLISVVGTIWALSALAQVLFGLPVRVPSVPRTRIPQPGFVLEPGQDLRSAIESLNLWAKLRGEALAPTPPIVPRFDSPPRGTPRRINEPSIRPATGELENAQRGNGAGTLVIVNSTPSDAYIRVTVRRQLVKSAYIRCGERVIIRMLLPGEYVVTTDLGQEWLPGLRKFRTDEQRLASVGPLEFVQIQSSSGIESDTYRITLAKQDK